MITYNNKIMYRTMAAAHTQTIKHKKRGTFRIFLLGTSLI